MSFANPWAFALLPLVSAWAFWEWRRTSRKAGVLLKALVFACVIAAWAEPRLTFFETKTAVAVLTDTSASIPDEQVEQQQDILRRMREARGRNLLRVFSFDETARPGSPARDASPRGTNIEAALRAGLSALPADRVPKIVLISDGWENQGAVERVVGPARRRGVSVSTIPLAGRRRPELRLKALSAPTRAFRGERFSIDAVIESPAVTAVDVSLEAEGKSIGQSSARLEAGENFLRLNARLDIAGSALVSGAIKSAEWGELVFEHTVSLAQPRVLLVSGDTVERDAHLLGVLRAAGFEIERTQDAFPPDLSDFQVIVVNNIHLEGLPLSGKERIEEFIREGGGFLQIAGENSLYVEQEENADDPLRRALPADPAPPRTPEGTAVVLILDKSSSMEGQKMDLARRSALGVVENLRPIDQVGVLVFDNSFEWVVSLQRNENPSATKELISSIIADGGTQIAPALTEAFEKVRPSEAAYKHILLLTDGISEEGDSIALAKEAAKLKITISTIGLGQDVNRAYLERVARTAEGKPHFLLDVSGLTQLVLRDVMEHTGSSVMEKDVRARVVRDVEILDEARIAEAGPLRGWVKFVAKPEAETILEIDEANEGTGERDPLLVRRQYGLGRATVFTSDAKQVWAANWIEWDGFDVFWTNLLRDVLPRAHGVEAEARFDAAEGEIVVRYRWAEAGGAARGRRAPETLPELYALGPDGFQHAAQIERVSTGVYEARVPVDDRQGLFRMRPASALELFPETAFYRVEAEAADYGSNPGLLRKIAAWTGGEFDPAPESVFTSSQATPAMMDLWPGFLALAIFLNLFELVARKGWTPWLRRWA